MYIRTTEAGHNPDISLKTAQRIILKTCEGGPVHVLDVVRTVRVQRDVPGLSEKFVIQCIERLEKHGYVAVLPTL